MNHSSPLRRRWTVNIFRVVLALGLVGVLAVTALFAAFSYSAMEKNLQRTARESKTFLTLYYGQDLDGYVEACTELAENWDLSDDITAQWIPMDAPVADSADENVERAVSTRGVVTYIGADRITGERIMAAVCPITFADGEIVGILRFSTPTGSVNRTVALVAAAGLLALAVILAVVISTSNVFLLSILEPLDMINEKAKTIADGSYGTQVAIKRPDEIGQLANTLNVLSSKISQNEKMQAEFISSLSHELRTPLTVINGWSETLLADESMDVDTQRGMKIISGEAKRLTEMVMDLLDFTRLQDGRMTLAIEQSDILGAFEDTVYMYRSRLSQDGIKLEYQVCDEDIPEIPCDAKRLRQVFLNILDNAAKHGGEGKKIDASISCDGGNVVIRIRDYGPGIPEDEIPLVKKKFYKGSSKARGTGIGLAVSDEIVSMHGGSLTLENAAGGGTLVTVSLPQTH